MLRTTRLIAIILFMTTLCAKLLAQDRVNEATPYKFFWIGTKVNKAMYWETGLDGVWESNKNDKYSTKYSSSNSNFASFNFNKLKIDNKDYYVLMNIFYDGRYKYPNIQEGYGFYKTIQGTIFTIPEIEKIITIQQGECLMATSHTTESMSSLVDITTFIAILARKYVENVNKNTKSDVVAFVVERTISDGIDVIRFNMPNLVWQWPVNAKVRRPTDNKRYFEMPTNEFEKLFIESKKKK